MMQVVIDETKITKVENAIKDITQPTQIKTQEDADNSGIILKLIKTRLKDLVAERKSLTADLDSAKKKIMDLYRPITDALENLESGWKKMLVDYNREQEIIRQREEQRISEKQEAEARRLLKRADEAKKEETKERLLEEAEMKKSATPIIPQQKTQNVHYRIKYGYVVTDKNAVPEDFKVIDNSALLGFIRATKGEKPIDGINITKEKTVVAGR